MVRGRVLPMVIALLSASALAALQYEHDRAPPKKAPFIPVEISGCKDAVSVGLMTSIRNEPGKWTSDGGFKMAGPKDVGLWIANEAYGLEVINTEDGIDNAGNSGLKVPEECKIPMRAVVDDWLRRYYAGRLGS